MATKEKKTYRLVNADNFDGDYPNEQWIAIGITDKRDAELFAEAWNARWSGNGEPRFCKVVEHVEVEYQLQPGFEP